MNQTAKRAASVAFACLFFSSIAAAAEEPEKHEGKAASKLDTTAIDKAIGKSGELKGEVYKISMPRTDLKVMVKDVTLKPGLALGSWVAFKEAGNEAVVDGDLVLTEDEVAPVFDKLRKEGIEVTALHNHLIGETPRVMFLHIAGKGDAADQIRGLTDGKGVDYAFEVIGNVNVIQDAFHAVRRGGKLVVVGVPPIGVSVTCKFPSRGMNT